MADNQIYFCKDCRFKLKGIREVIKHYEKYKHYNYNLANSHLVLSFAGGKK